VKQNETSNDVRRERRDTEFEGRGAVVLCAVPDAGAARRGAAAII